MSQLLIAAAIPLLLLVGIVSADVMGFAFWKSNQFPIEGKVIHSIHSINNFRLTCRQDGSPHGLLPRNGP